MYFKRGEEPLQIKTEQPDTSRQDDIPLTGK